MAHAQTQQVKCPRILQQPLGKKLKISFIGIEPFIKYKPFGGSEFKVMRILADKFGFSPKFHPERAFDIIIANGTAYGMVHRVSKKKVR